MSDGVNRKMGVSIVVGILSIIAVGLGAATLTTAVTLDPSRGGTIISPPQPQEVLDFGGGGMAHGNKTVINSGGGSFGSLTSCYPFLDSALGLLLVIASLFVLMGVLYSRYNAALSLFIGWTVAPPMALAYLILTDCGSTQQFIGQDGISFGDVGQTLVPASEVPPWIVGVFVVGAVVVAAIVLYRTAEEDEVVVEPDEDENDDLDLGQFAAAAGRAADRIEDRNVDVDNAVYAAWIEMTQLLDVDKPETFAPTEFATEAIDLGMAENDVEGLTRLFNEVRYGGKEADVREDKATDILRSIEAEYGTDENPDMDDTDTIDDEAIDTADATPTGDDTDIDGDIGE